MTLSIGYFDRDPEDPGRAVGDQHVIHITGENARECMQEYWEFTDNFDLAKYTIPNIFNITDD